MTKPNQIVRSIGGLDRTAAPTGALEIVSATPPPPLIREGTYDAVGGDSRVRPMFGGFKLVVDIHVLVPDPQAPDGFGRVRLQRFYNVRRAPGGRFRVGPQTDYTREWQIVAGRRRTRRDRLSPALFKDTLVEVVVRTVTSDSRQRSLGVVNAYSVVDRIVAVKAGGSPAR